MSIIQCIITFTAIRSVGCWWRVSRGVIYNQMDAVFVRNLQYTKLSQTPLQKIMHLATLRLYAAGGVVRISGINYEEARLLRVQLGKKMEVEHGEHDHD